MADVGAATAALIPVMKLAKGISNQLAPYLRFDSQELRVDGATSAGHLSMYATARGGWKKKAARTLKFHDERLTRMEVRASPMGTPQPQAVRRAEAGYELVPRLLGESDHFQIDFEFRIDHDTFIEALVHQTKQKDVLDDRDDYFITAQLKHPKAIKDAGYMIDIRNVDFHLDVEVHQDIKKLMPPAFMESLDTVSSWIRATDRESKARLSMEHLRQGRQGIGPEVLDAINSIQNLFVPSAFESFIAVERDFHLAHVRRGMEYYDRVPTRTFPRAMTVVSKTDISVDNPAKEGQVIYQRSDFQKALDGLFPKQHRTMKA